ncbi:hypothetical protein [Vibrio pectenicida]|uniref:Uncharacterized protein n=1 Tax=Vibrio pectenicida TaxID=62763 RepID=A0A427TZD3_9VIBR|nr:hypothetical protein [Vibrio pectenicida]RSD29821.1 hypothetical protein EJA03_17155 [Vibrio pectenicida]
MINVFEGIVRQDVFGEKEEFEQLLSQTKQDVSQPDSSSAVDVSEADAALDIDSLDSSCDHTPLFGEKALSTPEVNVPETSAQMLGKQSEHGLSLVANIANKMSAKPADYPAIKLDKVTWQSSVHALVMTLTEKPGANNKTVNTSTNSASVMTTLRDAKPETSRNLAIDSYLQKPLLGPMQHGDVKNHSSLFSGGALSTQGGELANKVRRTATTLDTSTHYRTGLQFTNRNLVFNGGIIRSSQHVGNSELSGKVVNVHNKNLISGNSEISVMNEGVNSISSLMKPIPLTEMTFPNYNLAPELFWQHPRLNSYVVMYRSKYYLFEFDEHKMINYLEYSDDRN